MFKEEKKGNWLKKFILISKYAIYAPLNCIEKPFSSSCDEHN